MTADTRAAAERTRMILDDSDDPCIILPEEIADIRTVLDSLPEWRDRPTVPGLWLLWFGNPTEPFMAIDLFPYFLDQQQVDEFDPENYAAAYGPLPPPPEEQRKDGE